MVEMQDGKKQVDADVLAVAEGMEIQLLERSLAFNHAHDVITADCVDVDDEGRWWDTTGAVEFEDSEFVDALRYLELRGLVERHASEANWISLRDESEAVR